MIEHFSFRVHSNGEMKTFTEKELADYAAEVGLDCVAPNRYSWLFVMQLFLHSEVNGIDPSMIVEEIKALEGSDSRIGTKRATQFTREPLKGLWHKHFFSAHFVAHNIVNQLSGGRLAALVEEVLDPAISPVITADMINELSHRATSETFEAREAEEKLTGEWIVFAKHCGVHYYLSLATHATGDQVIYDQINSVCFAQFPFLKPGTQP